jgi:dipeptidyl aminopeptidase/acylaminoacyl peptidase
MFRDSFWSFEVSPPLLAYLWPADDPRSVYALDPGNGETFIIIEESQGISDFHFDISGVNLFYSTRDEADNSVIRKFDRLIMQTNDVLSCENATCYYPQISPQLDYLAYERQPISGETPSGNQVWLLPLKDGAPFQVSEINHQAGGVFWSPTGKLTFYDRDTQSFVIYDPVGQESISIHNETGGTASWSADGRDLVISEVEFWGDGPMDFVSHLWRIRFPQLIEFNLSNLRDIEDFSPVYSQDGEWLAFGRKYLDEENWTPGRQLWLMQSDGSNPRPLTDAPDFSHADFVWHPEESYIAYVRHNQSMPTDPAEIWLINVDDSTASRLVINGHFLQWIP